MKKIITILFIIFFSTINAQAYVVNYDITGRPTNVSGFNGRNYYTKSINNFGSNASFLPQNTERAGIRQRQIQNEKEYLETLKNTKTINVNVNHNGYPVNTYYNNPYNRYYNQGYNRVYYNNGYPSGVYYNNGNGIRIPGLRMF